MLDAGARTDLFARGEGGTPLVAALFWGHREVATAARPRAGEPPRCRRAWRPRAHPRSRRHAAGRRAPRLLPAARRLPSLAALRRPAGSARRGARLGGEVRSCRRRYRLLVELGARIDADPYRGTALTWAAANGRVDSIRALVGLGADVNQRGTFGGPEPRRRRHRDPPRGAVGTAGGGRGAARARSGSAHPRQTSRRQRARMGTLQRPRRPRRSPALTSRC